MLKSKFRGGKGEGIQQASERPARAGREILSEGISCGPDEEDELSTANTKLSDCRSSTQLSDMMASKIYLQIWQYIFSVQ